MMLQRFISAAILVFTLQTAHAIDSGDMPPAFKLPTLQNSDAKSLSLTDFKGKVVYVDFWASWCGPCRQSLPILNTLREKYKAEGFEVIAINVDENTDDAKAFLKKYPVNYPIVSDPAAKTPELYKINGMPTAFLIGKDGKVKYKHEGFKKSETEALDKKIRNFLSK